MANPPKKQVKRLFYLKHETVRVLSLGLTVASSIRRTVMS